MNGRCPRPTSSFVPHTDWDREWYRTHEAFRSRLIDLLDALIPMLAGDPRFRHFTLDGQTIVLEDYREVRPEARERIAKLVAAVRIGSSSRSGSTIRTTPSGSPRPTAAQRRPSFLVVWEDPTRGSPMENARSRSTIRRSW